MIYILKQDGETFFPHPMVPFHRTIDDWSSDLGTLWNGRSAQALLGRIGRRYTAAEWADVASDIRDTVFSAGVGRGVRIVPLPAGKSPSFYDVVMALGLSTAGLKKDEAGALKIYCCPHNAKAMSPLFQDDLISLFCCSNVLRRSVAKTFTSSRHVANIPSGGTANIAGVHQIVLTYNSATKTMASAFLVDVVCLARNYLLNFDSVRPAPR